MNAVNADRQTPKLLLTFLFAGGLINYMDRAIMGLLGPAMRADLGLSAGHFGIAMSAFSVGYTLFTLIGGWAADRYGSARVLLATMLVWSIFAGLTGFVTTIGALILVRFLFGAGEAPWLSAFNKILVDRLPKEKFSTFHSLCSSGQPLGGAIAGPVIGVVTAAYGWRWGFFAAGIVGLVWAALWLLLVFSKARAFEKKQATVAQVDVIRDRNEQASEQSPDAVSRGDLMRNRTIWICIFAMACSTYLMVFFFSWFPSYLSERHNLNDRELGLISALPWLVGVFAYATGGMLSDWLAKRLGSLLRARRLIMTVCLLGSGFFTVLVPASDTLSQAVLLMSIGMGLMFLTGSAYFAIGLAVTPIGLVGFISGIFLFCSNIAATIAPALSGYMIDWTGTYDTSFFVAGFLVIAAALIGFFTLRDASPHTASVAKAL